MIIKPTFKAFAGLSFMESAEKANYVVLNVTDGTQMAAYVSHKNHTEPVPGLILLQEAFGVNNHIRRVADRYADEGYFVVAPELFHRTTPQGFEASYKDFPSVMPHMNALTTEGLTADLQAAYQWLTQQNIKTDTVFSIGYCLGGRVSFLANAVLPVKAGISYYGGSVEKLAHLAPQMHGPHLFFWGGKDKHIPEISINTIIGALDDAGKDYVNVKFSSADHGFNCDERESYHAEAAKQAQTLALSFLKSYQ